MKRGYRVKSIFGVVTLCAVFFFGLQAILRAQHASGTSAVAKQGIMVGEWKLLPAKSDFGGGQKLMAMETKGTKDGAEGIEYTTSVTYESGFHADYSFKGAPDSKEYPITGGATIYTYTEESGVVHETQKDSDGTITQGDFTVSASGKQGIWKYTVTSPDGTVIHQRLVFERMP